MKELFTLNYWFHYYFKPFSILTKNIFLYGSYALLVLAILFYFLKKKKGLYQRVYAQAHNFSLANGLVGLVLMFFYYEETPFLSAHFWFLLWVLEMLLWLFFIIREFTRIPARRQAMAENKEFRKYLP